MANARSSKGEGSEWGVRKAQSRLDAHATVTVAVAVTVAAIATAVTVAVVVVVALLLRLPCRASTLRSAEVIVAVRGN